MPGGRLAWERGGGGAARAVRARRHQGIKRKGLVERGSGGARSPPSPWAQPVVAQGVLSDGFKLWKSRLTDVGKGFPACRRQEGPW